MDSNPDVFEHESSAKRRKIGFAAADCSVPSLHGGFSGFSTTLDGPIDTQEGTSADCDSGYEASTLESFHTPGSSHQTSPNTDAGDLQETLSDMSEPCSQTPTRNNSTDSSEGSNESEFSNISGQDWNPMAGSMIWIQQQMHSGINPRALLNNLDFDMEQLPDCIDDVTLWKIIINMLAEPPRRHKLKDVNTLDDVVRLLNGAKNVIVLTGAGVSVSCGIPDFRSRDGIYSRLAIDFPNLPDPHAMFDINFFSQDPRPFFKFARDIYPGKFQPGPCHRFIRMLERQKKLLRNYTQNIDTLEKEANIERVIECHGSFATATCTRCGYKMTAEMIRDSVLAQKIPLCQVCHEGGGVAVGTEDSATAADGGDFRDLVESGIMKPDIVFFGEGLPDTFHDAMAEDKSQCDLLVVIGSSLKVRPVALIPSSLPAHVPQILINREPLPHCHFDVELLGDCDVIINHLCQLMGSSWQECVYNPTTLNEADSLLTLNSPSTFIFDKTDPTRSKSESSLEVCSKCQSSSSSCSSDREDILCTCSTYSTDSREFGTIKERHMSIDSARDSGIGDNSNFTDLETKYDEDENSTARNLDEVEDKRDTDPDEYWQSKTKKSLADRLPKNSFHLMPPSRYIFPGAELYYDDS